VGKSSIPYSKLAALENVLIVWSFTPAEIPHGDDPTDEAQTNDDIGVECHL
jgi:hypothetical protein